MGRVSSGLYAFINILLNFERNISLISGIIFPFGYRHFLNLHQLI
jgi:hypothetical protein